MTTGNENVGIASDYRKCGSPKLSQFESDFMFNENEHENLVDQGEVCTINIINQKRKKRNQNIIDNIRYLDA